MKECCRCRELLIDLLEGELSVKLREEVLQHIKNCAQCALEYAKLQKLSEVMMQDEVVLPRAGTFESMKQIARQQVSQPRRRLLWRVVQVFVPAFAVAVALFMIFRGRGDTVEMSIPVANLLEDADIAGIAVSGIISQDILDEIGELERGMMQDTDEMIDEMSDNEKKELVNILHQKYAVGT